MALRVEVVLARPEGADIVSLELPRGARVRDALTASGMRFDLGAVGIFGRRVSADTPLADGDRVEIYRPLHLDPKERRRRRAKKARKR
jgi:hypothetical protein